MSGVTDLAFRLISRKFGAGLCFFEMLDAKATLYEHPKNRRMLKTLKEDSPIAAQLVGGDPYVMLEAAQKLLSIVKISFLDVNSACPAKKIIKKGAGAALIKDASTLGKIIDKLASELRIPVTVKLRSGFKGRDVKECVKIAKICEANGASCVFIHGRTMSQGYSGDIDYESIKAVKDALNIPVFGSGNIFTPPMAKRMLDETGCDGILVARGAFGNPWIFKDIEDYLKKGEPAKPIGPVRHGEAMQVPNGVNLSLRKKILRQHLAYIEKYKEIAESNKIGFMGKVTMWYFKGFYNAARIRDSIGRVKSYRELLDLINRVNLP